LDGTNSITEWNYCSEQTFRRTARETKKEEESIMKSDKEIKQVLLRTSKEQLDLYPLPYIDGVVAALEWILDTDGSSKKPFTDYDEEK
jgi:hypothetical protein